jgi:hypothetical protein
MGGTSERDIRTISLARPREESVMKRMIRSMARMEKATRYMSDDEASQDRVIWVIKENDRVYDSIKGPNDPEGEKLLIPLFPRRYISCGLLLTSIGNGKSL